MPLTKFRRRHIWYVRGTVAKTTVYETTGSADRERAEAYRARREAQLWDRRFFGERATVSVGEAAAKYIEEKQPGDGDKLLIARILAHFGETKLLTDIDQAAADGMLRGVLRNADTAAPATKRRTLSPLEAILNHAARRGWCNWPAFVKPDLVKAKPRWLTPVEAQALMQAAAKHLRPLLHFLLCTGARLTEALELDWDQVDLAAETATFLETKNDRIRVAALPSACVVTLANLDRKEGAVFRRDDGEAYADKGRIEGGQIKTAFRTACRRAGLGTWLPATAFLAPAARTFDPDTTPHDLRHTWASWFYALTKDPLLLKVEGGWATLAQVERYAHLMPAKFIQDIRVVWGETHPRIRANPVQPPPAAAKTA